MAKDDLLLAPETLDALCAGIVELGPALGAQAAPGLARVKATLEQAIAARRDGDTARAVQAITVAMQQLVELASTLDPQEAAMMRAIAGQFTSSLQRGDAAHAADSVDTMRKRSGATKKRGDEFKL
jgi:hypothetical protein